MTALRSVLRRVLYRYGWDTRCRNWLPARMLRGMVTDSASHAQPVLLDVGCGEIGLAAFLEEVDVVGVDIEPSAESAPNFTFRQGTITDLPFPDRSFPMVSCIDVLEHLSLADRDRAFSELTRVASRAVLIACPHGETAQRCDDEFRRSLKARGRPVPAWVLEHQAQPYPTSSSVVEKLHVAAAESGRTVTTSLSYCEPRVACRVVRRTAARSNALYAAVNLILGALLPVIPRPGADDSYRLVLLAEFSS